MGKINNPGRVYSHDACNLFAILERDLFIALGTFLISILFSVETGLLFGTGANAVFLLYLSARPTVEVELRKVRNN